MDAAPFLPGRRPKPLDPIVPVSTMSHVPRTLVLSTVLALTCGTAASAQCTTPWIAGDGTPGANDDVLAATTWDPDGPGPLGEHVVLGGRFTLFGDLAAAHVVRWDPVTGSRTRLGEGFDREVRALQVLPNGDLVAAGDFTASGSAAMLGIARWNGTAWESLGGGLGARIVALGLANGDLVADTDTVSPLQRWDGSQWAPLGSSVLVAAGTTTTLGNGDLVLGGDLFGPSGTLHLLRWSGSAWQGIGDPDDTVLALCKMPNGDLVAAGEFSSIGGTPIAGLGRWNGTAWSEIPGAPGAVRVLHGLPNGDLLVGGDFAAAGGVATGGLARWSGGAWSSLMPASSPRPVDALAPLPGGDMLVCGAFETAQAQPIRSVARLTSAGLQPLFAGSPARTLRDADLLPNGSLVAIGTFDFSGALQEFVAVRTGSTWSPIGTALAGTGQRLEVLPDGSIVAKVGSDLMRFDGIGWTTISLNGGIQDFAALTNGELIAVGTAVPLSNGSTSRLARYDGSAWTAVPPPPGFLGNILPLPIAATADGGFVVPGYASSGSTLTRRFWRRNGGSWSTFDHPGTTPNLTVVKELRDGSLVVGGSFLLSRWDGATWSNYGSGIGGLVRALHELPNGELLVAGIFSQVGGLPADGLARWNGSTWIPLDTTPGTGVTRLVSLPNGDVAMVGSFTSIGDQPAAYYAELTTTCPATRVVTGPGCGGLTLTTTLPWTGSVLRADASGLVAPSLAYWVLGFSSTSIPISAVIATAPPSCVLHVHPDVYGLQFANDGHSRLALTLPDVPALVGVALHHQQVALALDATFAISATEALELTVGRF